MNKKRTIIAWGLFLLTPILLHPTYLRAQTTSWGSGSGGSVTPSGVTTATTCVDSGVNDTYTCTMTGVASYTDILGLSLGVRFNTQNTGAATLNINGIGAQAIVKPLNTSASQALVTGDISATSWGIVQWDGTNFQLKSVPTSSLWANSNNTISTGTSTVFGGTATVVFGAAATGLSILSNTTQTPDSSVFYTGTLSEAINVFQVGDAAFDFNNGRCGTAACSNSSLIIHSSDQSTTEYAHISTDTTGAAGFQSNFAELRVGGTKSAITEGSPQAIVRFGIPTGTNVFGATVFYSVYDLNGANYVVRSGQVRVQGGNASGTATCTINTTQDTEGEDGSQIATSNAYTLTYTWTNVVATTNCDLSLNAASSAGTNTYGITWTAVVTGNAAAVTVTGQ